MVLRTVSPFNSGSTHEYTMPVRPQPHVSQLVDDDHQYPFYQDHLASRPESYAHTPASKASAMVFSPWLELPSSTTPLSRASSLTGSEYVPTPTPYMEQPPMFSTIDPQLPPSSNYLMKDPNYVRDQEFAWRPHLSPECAPQQPLPTTSLSAWIENESTYENTLVQEMRDFYTQPFTNHQTPTFIQSVPETGTVQRNETSFIPSYTESSTASSGSDSEDTEDEEGGSSYSKRKGSRSSSRSSRGASRGMTILKCGRWDLSNDPFNRPQQRNYVCGRIENAGPDERRCNGSFQRPEHLRRHIKTVHGADRDYSCRLPQCRKAFSRGDNLREHYWTHLERGGRAGKNEKMSFAELKAVLGPKEKKLLRRLRHRLSAHQAKLGFWDHSVKLRCKL